MEIPYSRITIDFTGISKEETETYRQIINRLFEKGVFRIRNGKAILHFDDNGLAEIEADIKLWKRGKETQEIKPLEQFRVAMTPVDKSTFATKA